MFNSPILHAEDDENDAFLIQRAFKRAAILNPLVVVSDGKAAIDYLAGQGKYAERKDHPIPCLILLDLKMPGKSGLEVLEWIQNQSTFSTLPSLMLTSSNQEKDIRQAYLLGANGYLMKPNAPDGMLVLAKAIKDFWLSLNLYVGG
jgi:CheY-like chemotaxis protein